MVRDIFSSIIAHQVEGLMFHNDMTDYFLFLSMNSMARLHEKQYIDESRDMRATHEFYVKHYNELPNVIRVNTVSYIPETWYNHVREDVDHDTRLSAVKSGLSKWIEWEKNTKAFYEQCHRDLAEDIVAADYVHLLIRDVSAEIEYAEQICLELKATNYDPEVMMGIG